MEYADKNNQIKMSPEMKNILLELTMNCLLDHPQCVQPYAYDYFNRKLESKTVIVKDMVKELEVEPGEMSADELTIIRETVVFAETYQPDKDEEGTKSLMVYPKTQAEKDTVRRVANDCLLFGLLEEDELELVIDLMFPIEVKEGEEIIKEGDEGDNFYVIESGIYEVWRRENDKNVLIRSYIDEGNFGELALMYNVPRTATVRAVSEGRLWALDRLTFRKAVLHTAYKKRRDYEEFISNVLILQELTPYERMVLADALVPYIFNEGEVIIQEGDSADGMYFIEYGSVQVEMKLGGSIRDIRVMGRGDYFGEFELINYLPREATIKTLERTKVAFLDKNAFERMLGPCVDIIKRNIAIYHAEKESVYGE